MSSAKSVTEGSITRKIQRDQKPRRLALKLASRRAAMGSRWMNPRRALFLSPTADDSAPTTSRFPSLEIDARIDQSVSEVADEVEKQAQQA